jgi:hypothetical protein
MMKRYTMFALVALAVFALGACTRAVLLPAQPILVPHGVTQPQVKQSIISALDGRGWSVDKAQDGKILTTLRLRDHTATVRINYNTKTVHITYVSSSNLEYSQHGNTRYIHRNYNGWVGFLEQDIKRNLQNASIYNKS